MERISEKVAAFLNSCKDNLAEEVLSMLDSDGQLVHERDASGRTGLHFAAFYGHASIIMLLAQRNANVHQVDFDQLTPLMLAVKKGEENSINCLLDCRADINFTSSSHVSALHHAAAVGNVGMMEMLLKRGAVITTEPTEKGTVLHWATFSGILDPMAMLLDEYNLQMALKDSNGGTILHRAVAAEHSDLVLFLLERQADPNAKAETGCTPLHLITELGNNVEILQHLLTFGADITADDSGETPVTHATKRGQSSFLKELQKKISGGYQWTEEQRVKNTERFKAQGNKVFQEGESSKSSKFYTLAISFQPKNHILFSNRSAAYYNLRKLPHALADACHCVRLKPDWPKGYFRKGATLVLLGKLEQAKNVFTEGLKIDPNNADLKCAIKDLYEKMASQAKSTATPLKTS